MSDAKTTAEQWAASVAACAVDALLDAGLVSRDQFETASVVVAEEIFVRLCLNDYPPSVDYGRIGEIGARPDADERGSIARGASSTLPTSAPGPRPYGLAAGAFVVPDDFDDPLPDDLLDAFEGR